MKRFSKGIKIVSVLIILLFIAGYIFRQNLVLLYHAPAQGTAIDSLNHVLVFYNGAVSNVHGRRTTKDGYNLGLQFQCVEFVKRYYYEYYHHKMPDSYGHAVSFYQEGLSDSVYNSLRNLIQYKNPSKSRPKTGDLLVYSGTSGNPYGHVAIISKTTDDKVEIIQQNPGIGAPSRVTFSLNKVDGKYKIGNDRILGWLRMK